MSTLSGKTLFITGASRGIGRAIALRAARDGANVAIAAKSSVPNPKLPGTIHSAPKRSIAAGGQALALQVRHPRGGPRAGGGGGHGRALRRHRYPGQQRQRDLAARRAGHADEALRPDAAGQRARQLPVRAGLPAAPAEVGRTRTS
jgi:NAD(P)-dependent dehydrogenase (short-subunit alcohol dehydrogenase family)